LAITLETYAPFDSGAGSNVTEDTWRKFMKYNQGGSGVMRGILNSFNVYADNTGMQVKVQSGECWIQGHWGTKTTETPLSIVAAHATLARKDRVVLRADFTNDRIELDVLTGTAAASPSVPSLTQNTSKWETSLAVVTVPAADTSIDSTQVSANVHYTSAFTQYQRDNATSQTLANNTVQKNDYPTAVDTCADVVVTGTNNTDFTLQRSGLWAVSWQTAINTPNQTGYRTTFLGLSSDSNTRYGGPSGYTDSNGWAIMTPTVTRRFAANTGLSIYSYQTCGASGTVQSTSSLGTNFVTFSWLGW
jgi:hypothetical protein